MNYFFFIFLICLAPLSLYMLTADERILDFASHAIMFFAGFTFAMGIL